MYNNTLLFCGFFWFFYFSCYAVLFVCFFVSFFLALSLFGLIFEQFMYVLYDDYSYQTAGRQIFMVKIINFVFDKDNTFDSDNELEMLSLTAKQDRILRICCVSYHFHSNSICKNLKLYKFLEDKKKSHNKFYKVSLQNLLDNCDKDTTKRVSFFARTIDVFKRGIKSQKESMQSVKEKLNNQTYRPYDWEFIHPCGLCLKQLAVGWLLSFIFILIPLWCITRVFYLAFPIISLVNEMQYYVNNSNKNTSWNLIWNIIGNNEIVTLQIILTGIYWFLVIIWIVNLINVLSFYYWLKFVGLGSDYWSLWDTKPQKVYNDIVKQYQDMYDEMVVKEILCDFYGNDIASIVFYYYTNINLEPRTVSLQLPKI